MSVPDAALDGAFAPRSSQNPGIAMAGPVSIARCTVAAPSWVV
jgi:hypothetical protein